MIWPFVAVVFSRRLVASDPRKKATIGEMAIVDRTTVCGTTVKASSETSCRSLSSRRFQPGLRSLGLRPFTDPATKVSDAKERVIKLERALVAMEVIDGSEVDAIRDALERAKKAAQSPPVETQRDCEQFLVRARAHLEAIDAQRATVVASIEEGSQRLESLKVVQQTQPPQTPDTSSEVHKLQALVVQLQS